jgi:hypothetical protein
MSVFKILGGIVVGVGAVALAPFTGGGSLIGAATLAGSLAGAGALAAGAGVVGGVAGGVLDARAKQNEEEKVKNAFKEGAKAAENEMKKRLQPFINDVFTRNQIVILTTTIGMAVAKCDNNIAKEELEEIKKYSGMINANAYFPDHIKQKVQQIFDHGATFEDVKIETNKLIAGISKEARIECLHFLDKLIIDIIKADQIINPSEKAFQKNWLEFVQSYR